MFNKRSAAMVRVFRSQQFKGQAVFSSDGEPVALACSDEWLFIATARCQIEVHPLLAGLDADSGQGEIDAADCSSVAYRFPTVSPVISLAHNSRMDCVASLEKHKQKRKNTTAARIYFNWKCGKPGQSARILLAGGPEGIPVSAGSQSLPSFSSSPARLSVVELPCPGLATCISCCPRTGSMAVGGENRVRVFVLGLRGLSSNRSYSVEHLLDVDVGCKVTSVALCENYLAVMSSKDVRVMYIDVASALAVTDIPPAMKQQAHARSEDAYTALHVWRSESACVDTDDVLELNATKNEASCRDEAERAREVLGPVRTVWGRPVEVYVAALFSGSGSGGDDTPGGKGGVTTLLYRQFSATDVRDGLHSLQLIPVYDERRIPGDPLAAGQASDEDDCAEDDENFGDSRWLSAMYCFFSTPRQGYQYSVLVCTPTSLVTTYPYISRTTAVSICGPLLQAITANGLETYTLRTFATAAGQAFACNGYPYGTRRESTVSNSRKRSRTQRETERVRRIPKLAEFCPPHGDICVLGMHPFYELCHVQALDTCLVLLSKAEGESEKPRETKDSFTKSFSLLRRRETPEPECSSWSVYVLHYVPMPELYNNLSLLAEKHKFMSAPVYGELLSEAGLLIRSRLLSLSLHLPARPLDMSLDESILNSVDESPVTKALEKERSDLCNLLFECNRLLGDLCCRPDAGHPEWAPRYYRLAALSISEIAGRALKQASELETEERHSVCYGMGTVLTLETWMAAATPRYMAELPASVSNDIFKIFSAVKPELLSFLVLESGLTSYSNELAVKCIYDSVKTSSTQRLSAKDAFALCVLHLRLAEVEEACTVLKTVAKDELLSVCIERQCCMLDGDHLSHIAQLLRQHTPDILLSVLISVHASGAASVATVLTALGMDASGSNLAMNNHARLFLEAVLSDERQGHCYEVAANLACKIYWERFLNGVNIKNVVSQPQVPTGGHFASRYRWLDLLPPFQSGIEVTCAVHCGPRTTPSGLVVARSGSPVLTQLVLKSRHSVAVTSVSTNGPPTSYQHVPNCRCAYADLVSAQSLLCWRAVSRQLVSGLLQQLQSQKLLPEHGSESDGQVSPVPTALQDTTVEAAWLSLQALCCLRLDRHLRATQLLVNKYPATALELAKCHFAADPAKWRPFMQSLLSLCGDEVEEGVAGQSSSSPVEVVDHSEYRQVYQDALLFAAQRLEPNHFLQLLPAHGSAHFFLPFIETCFRRASTGKLADKLAQALPSV